MWGQKESEEELTSCLPGSRGEPECPCLLFPIQMCKPRGSSKGCLPWSWEASLPGCGTRGHGKHLANWLWLLCLRRQRSMVMQRHFKGKAQAAPRPRGSFNSGSLVCFIKHTSAECVTHDTSDNLPTTRERPAAKEAWVSLSAF